MLGILCYVECAIKQQCKNNRKNVIITSKTTNYYNEINSAHAKWPKQLSHCKAANMFKFTNLHISCVPKMSQPKHQGAFFTSISHTGVSQTTGKLCTFVSVWETETEFFTGRIHDDKWLYER